MDRAGEFVLLRSYCQAVPRITVCSMTGIAAMENETL